MFPIRDDNPHYLTPYVTYGIIAVNALAWFFVQGAGNEAALVRSVCEFGAIPAELLGKASPGETVELGQNMCLLGRPAWYTAVTSMFMHGGWMHIIGNMWFLWIFGNNVEDSMGHVRFIIFYLLCGLAAFGLQLAFDPASPIPMVGASGAIGGVMGAYIVLYPRVRVHMLFFLGFFVTTFAIPAVWMLGYWIVIQLIGGARSLGDPGAGGVAFWAHVGGFAAGALLIFFFRDKRLVDRHPYHGWNHPSPKTFRRGSHDLFRH
jgi:membrane associated rhomboid family serine protease